MLLYQIENYFMNWYHELTYIVNLHANFVIFSRGKLEVLAGLDKHFSEKHIVYIWEIFLSKKI
jgi:hypothetical protein